MTAPFEEDRTTYESGVVVFWHGDLSSMPTGFVLADGNNGSPDLTDKFVKPPVDYSDGAGASGGAASKSLVSSQMPSHDHIGSTGGGGYHSHSISGFRNRGSGLNVDAFNDGGGNSLGTSSNGSHSHSGSNSATAGTGNSIDNRPHYYEVAFIYKL